MARKAQPSRLRASQQAAVQPSGNVWLSASAGTGKTHVLAARVFRLLLQPGVDPAHILCLTYTKAGAAEMANRINRTLARWVRMKDADLGGELIAIGASNNPAMRARARQLFAHVLNAPGGGLRIMTIHSFCQSLLASFPEEAAADIGFRPMEDGEAKLLARDALNQCLLDAEQAGDQALLDGVANLSLRLGEGEAEAFLQRCARAPEAMAALPVAAGIEPFARSLLALPREGDAAAVLAAQCSDAQAPIAAMRRLADAMGHWRTKTGEVAQHIILNWLGSNTYERAERLPALAEIWTKAKGDIRVAHKGLVKVASDAEHLFESLWDWSNDIIGQQSLLAYAALLADGLRAGQAYAAAYAAMKRAQGLLDFDDLIRLTVHLLRDSDMAQWIRYKLDQRTDHILIDESQDSNQAQWDIIAALSDDFFAGSATEPERLRTIFTVGDFKQAIFGFQGTNPKYYARARDEFLARGKAGSRDFADLDLDDNFRSSQIILDMVDAVLDHLGPERLGIDRAIPRHRSFHAERTGSVRLWAPVCAVAGDDVEAEYENGSDPDSDRDSGSDSHAEARAADHQAQFADQLARQIAQWLGPQTPLLIEARDPVNEQIIHRRARPGDIMILVSKRDTLATLILARLHAAGVSVAGIDRLRLDSPLVVKDLLSAIRFVLQPHDDLNLASLLVSPLIGWTQDELLAFGYRPHAQRSLSLWQFLRHNDALSERLLPLRDLLRIADLRSPYAFLEHILSGPMQGRAQCVARLSSAALDPMEELLSLALQFERTHIPDLQDFIDWFDRGEVEIKRDSELSNDEVKLLTVHGSKGLQAPIVILADATFNPDNKRKNAFALPDINRADPGNAPRFPAIMPRKAEQHGLLTRLVTRLDEEAANEHWRLFYVAMTRAEQHLIVAGAMGPSRKGIAPKDSWYNAFDLAMTGAGAEWQDDPIWGRQRAISSDFASLTATASNAQKTANEAAAIELPPWAMVPPPPEPRPSRPLAPSLLDSDDVLHPPALSEKLRAAAERGKAIHRLLQLLPTLPTEQRQSRARQWLAGRYAHWRDAMIAEVAATAASLIDDPQFALLFGDNALAEAPLVAVVGEQVISAVVDVMVIEPERILLVDYKTGHHVPADADDVPAGYLRQMAAYAAAAQVIFPGRAIAAALLYTGGPIWIDLPQGILAAHKPDFQRP